MASKVEKDIEVTSSGKDYLPKASEVMTKCFYEDPVVRYMVRNRLIQTFEPLQTSAETLILREFR